MKKLILMAAVNRRHVLPGCASLGVRREYAAGRILGKRGSFERIRNFDGEASMIYAHTQYAVAPEPYKQPDRPDFYERKYRDWWVKDYWDGSHWYYVKGGMVAKTQVREWREITKEKA